VRSASLSVYLAAEPAYQLTMKTTFLKSLVSYSKKGYSCLNGVYKGEGFIPFYSDNGPNL